MGDDMIQNRRLVYAWFGLRGIQDTFPGVHWQYEGDAGDSSHAFDTWLEAENAYNKLAAHAQVVGVVPDKTPVDLKLASAFKAAGQAAVGIATKEAMKQFGEAHLAQQRVAHLEAEIAKLADVLMKAFGGPTENESACEMAIRLLKDQQDRLWGFEPCPGCGRPNDRCKCEPCDEDDY